MRVSEMEEFQLTDGDILNVVEGERSGQVAMFLSRKDDRQLLCCDAEDNDIEFELSPDHVEYDGGQRVCGVGSQLCPHRLLSLIPNRYIMNHLEGERETTNMEICSGCGSGLNTVEKCRYCGELLCQDCEEIHTCDPE